MPGLDLYAQIGNPRMEDIYDKERSKRKKYYQKYDIDKILEEYENKTGEEIDTTQQDIIEQLKFTPEMLRKIGVDEETIERLVELNSIQDSLVLIEETLEKEKMDIKNADTLTVKDLQKIIELQKEQLVQKALSLPEPYVYGHDFFRRSTMKMFFDRHENMRPPDNYILSNNDELTIVYWNDKLDKSESYTIDDKGAIYPPVVGTIKLKGVTYGKAKSLIKEKYTRVFAVPKENIDIGLSFSRLVSVNFVGQLLNPGTYEFPALTTVYNALVALDGPNNWGSVRDIHIRRNGQLVKSLDLYEYLNNPDSRQDFYLEDNDYVLVSSLGNVVNISGEIRRPNNYEIREGEGLMEVIDFAGGLKAEAFTKNINVKRFQNNKEVLIDVNLDSLKLMKRDFVLQNGDSVFVYRVPIGMRNYVQVTGAVKVPGKYEVKKGDRVSDILFKTEGLLEDADVNYAYILRLKEDLSKKIIPFKLKEVLENEGSAYNFSVQNLDTIQVLSLADSRNDFPIKIFGSIRQQGEYEFAEGLTPTGFSADCRRLKTRSG